VLILNFCKNLTQKTLNCHTKIIQRQNLADSRTENVGKLEKYISESKKESFFKTMKPPSDN